MKVVAKWLFFASLLPTGTNAETNYLRNNDVEASRNEVGENTRKLETAKPVMHTFYHKIEPENYFRGMKTTGMSDEDDEKLVKSWEASWQQAGWDTRVIGIKEAMLHPDFEHYDKMLADAKTPEGKKLFGYYDKLCFFRWLAMAGIDGGWMSDNDTFPLMQTPITELPHDGKFTLYDSGGVPSLASGTKEEYNRMAHAILDNIYDQGVKQKFWSDMMAFMTIKSEYIMDKHVMKGRTAFALWQDMSAINDCDIILSETWAIHFSHTSVDTAVRSGIVDKNNFPETTNHSQIRAMIAPIVVQDLLKNCDKDKPS